MTAQEQTRIYDEIEERLHEMIRRSEAALQEFREEFDKSERAKRQIQANYQRRRLQRLAERL